MRQGDTSLLIFFLAQLPEVQWSHQQRHSEFSNELPRNYASLAQITMLKLSIKHCSLIAYIYPLLNRMFQEISSALFLV